MLEHAFESWKIIPQAALSHTQENLSRLKKALKPLKAAYSFLFELPAQALFFWSNPYWQHCVLSVWRFYWALQLKKSPQPVDLATIGALYYRSSDLAASARRLARELGKDWQINEKTIQEEKIPFKSDQTIQPETLKFLRLAVFDLVDLFKRDELPAFCLAHHRAYWSFCPFCSRENSSNK